MVSCPISSTDEPFSSAKSAVSTEAEQGPIDSVTEAPPFPAPPSVLPLQTLSEGSRGPESKTISDSTVRAPFLVQIGEGLRGWRRWAFDSPVGKDVAAEKEQGAAVPEAVAEGVEEAKGTLESMAPWQQHTPFHLAIPSSSIGKIGRFHDISAGISI
mmetsp:Transcript_15868/g.43099  ORF Transcript_15868/g.43099 Transcript_15868/m.43099 type:complete len:157 (+) Transcript_15868:462-932(+)